MHYTLPHVGGEPLWHRICAQIIDELRDGDFAACELLPSENDLAARFGVSRSVIRDALSNLEREGFLQRMRGIGTVIHREVIGMKARLDWKLEYNELIRSMGYTPSVDSVSLRTEPAGEKLAEQLQIIPGETIIVCEKRLLASGRPVIYSINRLPQRLFGGVSPNAIDWHMPVFDLLETHLGFAVDTDVASVAAVIGPPAIRQTLEAAEDEALLFINEVGYYRLVRPVFQSSGFYTSFFEFSMLRKRF